MNDLQKPRVEQFIAQRLAAVCVVLVQALSLAVLMNSYVFPISVAILACASLVALRKKWVISLPGDRWVLLLAVLFFLKFYFAPRVIRTDYQFIFSSFAYEIASYCLVLELLLLFRKENAEKIPLVFLAPAVIGLVFTGNVRLNHFRRIAMLVIVQVFLLCWMVFSVKSRREVPTTRPGSNRWRNSVMLGVLTLSAILGTLASVQLHRHERALEALLSAYLEIGNRGPVRSGFSNRGGLSDISSWRESGGDQLALRIESDSLPGYLRGKAFDEFNMNRWITTSRSRHLVPKTDSSTIQRFETALKKYDHFYLTSSRFPEQHVEMKIWPIDSETAGHCFAPPETSVVISMSRPVAIDPSDILTRPNERKIVPYSLLVEPSPKTVQDPSLVDFLQIPKNLDERTLKIADELFHLDDSPRQKMKRTEKFFQQNFLYQKGIQIPRGEDRLGYFLESRSAAHCEYFATATTILLRLGGVPARYVTGFYAQEQNSLNQSWVARRKDAHAWVEAYDSVSNTWIIVESTPSEGLPTLTKSSAWEQRRETIAHFFRSIQDDVSRGNYLRALWILVRPGILLLVVIGLGMGIAWLVQRKRVKAVQVEISYDEFHKELIQEREKMDLELAKQGVQRGPAETTTQFSYRLAAATDMKDAERYADWYQEYSACRFRPGYSTHQIEDLRSKRQFFQEQIKLQHRGATPSD